MLSCQKLLLLAGTYVYAYVRILDSSKKILRFFPHLGEKRRKPRRAQDLCLYEYYYSVYIPLIRGREGKLIYIVLLDMLSTRIHTVARQKKPW